ncbi:alpha/beta-hydrolase [Mycena sp. CBHHK59/15]|nr:alpha/beta-hydrolase [Mycena sp. CBHHK59/15]
MTPPVSKLLPSSDGTLIYAEASGDPGNPSVVFAHGFALSGIVFDKLSSDARVLDKLYLVRYDVRGHGRSGKPIKAEAYVSSLYAADFVAVMQGFSLDMPVFVGWSAGAPIAADICAHISPVPISGIIAVNGALCVATATKALKPKLLEMIGKLRSFDAVTAMNGRVEFVDCVFNDPGSVPFEIKAAWIGSTAMQTPDITTSIMAGHRPDQTKLVELGSQGLPAMVLYGSNDRFQDGSVVADDARPHFKNLKVARIEGGSHSVFYDDLDETVRHILPFCLRVSGQRRPE